MRKPKPPVNAWLIAQRKARGWKPADVARYVDVAEPTVRGWESGRSIRDDMIDRLERTFGTTAPREMSFDGPFLDLGPLLERLDRQAAAIEAQAAAINRLAAVLGRRELDDDDPLAAVVPQGIEGLTEFVAEGDQPAAPTPRPDPAPTASR